MATADDTCYAVARRYLKHDLLGPLSASCGVRRILSCIPRRANVMIGFEARLRGRPHVVDLFLGFGSRQPSSLQIVVEALQRRAPQNSFAIYGGLQSFSANWEAESKRREGVDFLWLEYDAPHRSSSVIPGVFFGVGVETRIGNIDEWLSARYRDVQEISSGEIPRKTRTTIAQCLRCLPMGVVPTSVGFFPQRAHQKLRLCFTGFTVTTLTQFLRDNGYEGDVGPIGACLNDYRGRRAGLLADVGLVHLDIGTTIGKKVGIEFVFEFRDQVMHGRINPQFLDALVATGLGEASRCAALVSWPGMEFAGPPPRRLIMRRVNHIKLVFNDVGGVEAKAYFGFRPGAPPFLVTNSGCVKDRKRIGG